MSSARTASRICLQFQSPLLSTAVCCHQSQVHIKSVHSSKPLNISITFMGFLTNWTELWRATAVPRSISAVYSEHQKSRHTFSHFTNNYKCTGVSPGIWPPSLKLKKKIYNKEINLLKPTNNFT